MATTLGFSEINDMDGEEKELKREFNKKRKNRTIKNKITKTAKVEQFLNSMENMDNDDDDEQEGLAEFLPPPKPQLTKQKADIKENFEPMELGSGDQAVTPEGFKNLKEAREKYQQAYNNYVPYYSNSSAGSDMNYANRDELMRKLNYLIHMMEENKDEKTENVTEELVLYLFLGVFVIFVVDSFARAGKYTR